MHKFALKGAAVMSVAVAAAGVGIGIAQADTEVVIRPGDLNTSETRQTGHVDFLPYGLHVWTESNTSTDKAAGYFTLGTPLASITDSSMKWYGTTPQPGQQIVVDADGDDSTTNDRGILVGEPIYGDNWWLTPSSAQVLKDNAPHTGGGNGSDWFGTLDEWSGTSLSSIKALNGGFSLGSGVKGDGYIESITYGDTVYTFSSEDAVTPPAQAPVTGSFTKSGSGLTIKLDLKSDAAPDNTTASQRLKWEVKVDGYTTFLTQQDFGDQDTWAQKFIKKTGTHYIKVFRNDALVGSYSIRS